MDILYMGYLNGNISSDDSSVKGEKGDDGLPGIGFKLTDDGNFDIDEKRLTDVADPIDDGDAVTKKYVDSEIAKIPTVDTSGLLPRDGSRVMTGNLDLNDNKIINLADSTDDGDAVSLKVLKSHTQFSQNNYHLQKSFRIFKNFGDFGEINPVSLSKPSNPAPDYFFHTHKDCYIIPKEADGFSDLAWSNILMRNGLELGNYTLIFEIFTGVPNPSPPPSTTIVTDESKIFNIRGDDHCKILRCLQLSSFGLILSFLRDSYI